MKKCFSNSKKMLIVACSVIVVSVVALGVYQTFFKPKAKELQGEYSSRFTSAFTQPVSPLSELSLDFSGTNFPQNRTADNIRAAYAFNNDVVGTLKVPGTSIDTIVVGNDNNDYYLRNGYYKEYNRYGNVFIDYRCGKQELSWNTILYGHTTDKKEQAFYDLIKFTDPEFYKSNPVVEYSTLYKNYKWKVFAVFYSTVEPQDDNNYYFYYVYTRINEKSFDGYMNAVHERELYSTGVDVDFNDKILTLSTCTHVYGNDVNTRLVVMAKLMSDGESETVNAADIVLNEDYRRPQVWYNRNGKKNPYKDSKWEIQQ